MKRAFQAIIVPSKLMILYDFFLRTQHNESLEQPESELHCLVQNSCCRRRMSNEAINPILAKDVLTFVSYLAVLGNHSTKQKFYFFKVTYFRGQVVKTILTF
jgi:hypothetical protein